LLVARQEGRFIYYAPDFEEMSAWFLFDGELLRRGNLRSGVQTRRAQTKGESHMKRFHVHVSVRDLSESVSFYSSLFGAPPSVEKSDYAKWMLDDPKSTSPFRDAAARPGSTTLDSRWNPTAS